MYLLVLLLWTKLSLQYLVNVVYYEITSFGGATLYENPTDQTVEFFKKNF